MTNWYYEFSDSEDEVIVMTDCDYDVFINNITTFRNSAEEDVNTIPLRTAILRFILQLRQNGFNAKIIHINTGFEL